MTIWKHGQGNKTLRPWEHLPSLLEEHEHIDAYIGSMAVEWIQKYDQERPFYLQLALVGPHPPFDAPARYRDYFPPEDMLPPIMALPSEPISPQVSTMLERRGLPNLTESQGRLMKSHYYAKIAFDDDVIGSFLKVLREKRLMDNTWIIYTSDHGEMLGDHRLVQKVVFYEGSLNIPLIIRPPGGTSAWIGNGLTDHYDVVHTILSAANAATFEEDHGSSLIPKIEAGESASDAQIGKEVVFSEVNLYSMARTKKYKMTINSVSRKPLELYDLENDPHEINNLAGDPKYLTTVENLKEVMSKWQSSIGDIGLIPEAEIEIQEKQSSSRFEIMNGKKSDPNHIQKLVSVATKASEGISALPDLMKASNSQDPVIRYWAMTGFGNIGRKAGTAAEQLAVKAMNDTSPNVRIAAARAVAKFGQLNAALEVLKEELISEHQWGRLAATIVIDEMEEDARPLVNDLKKLLKTRQPNKYILRVANRALNDLLGTNNQVP